MRQRLTRSNSDQMFAGVASGVAEYFDVDPLIVRILFLLLLLLTGGTFLLVYIGLVVAMPLAAAEDADLVPASAEERGRQLGVLLIVAGTTLIVDRVFGIGIQMMTAIGVICLGFWLIARNRGSR